MVPHYTRNLFHSRGKPPGAWRILCLGDSLTFGSGVQPDQTLPAHLEALLNGACWGQVVEVINEGVSGHSLYDDWSQFLVAGAAYQPDLVVILLSDNDAELFSVSCLGDKRVSYQQWVEQCWSQGSPHLAHFSLALKQIGQQARAAGLPVVVGLYVIHEPAVLPRVAGVVEEACAAAGLDFLDLSLDFRPGQGLAPLSAWMASSEDSHPSGQAHQMAARRLARHLMAQGHVPPAGGQGLAEGEAVRMALDYLEDAALAGAPLEAALDRTLRALKARRQGRRRQALDPALRLARGELAILDASLERASGWHAQLLYWEGYCLHLHETQSSFFMESGAVSAGLVGVDRALASLARTLAQPDLWTLPPQPSGNITPQQLSAAWEKAAGWSNQLRQARASRDAQPGFHNGELSRLRQGLLARRQRVAEMSERVWSEAQACCQSLLSTMRRLGALSQAGQEGGAEAAWWEALRQQAWQVIHLGQSLERALGLLRLESVPGRWPHLPQPFVNLNIKAKSSHPTPFTLGVRLMPQAPLRPPNYDCLWVIRDGCQHLYQFKLPLFSLGSLLISLPAQAELEMEQPQLFLHPQAVVAVSTREVSAPASPERILLGEPVLVPLGLPLDEGGPQPGPPV